MLNVTVSYHIQKSDVRVKYIDYDIVNISEETFCEKFVICVCAEDMLICNAAWVQN